MFRQIHVLQNTHIRNYRIFFSVGCQHSNLVFHCCMDGMIPHDFTHCTHFAAVGSRHTKHTLHQFTASGTLKSGQSDDAAFFYRQIYIAKTFSAEILQFQDRIAEWSFFVYILIRVFLPNHHTCNVFRCSIFDISRTYKFSVSEYGISV